MAEKRDRKPKQGDTQETQVDPHLHPDFGKVPEFDEGTAAESALDIPGMRNQDQPGETNEGGTKRTR